MNKIACPWII